MIYAAHFYCFLLLTFYSLSPSLLQLRRSCAYNMDLQDCSRYKVHLEYQTLLSLLFFFTFKIFLTIEIEKPDCIQPHTSCIIYVIA